jgi:hypothetical protein
MEVKTEMVNIKSELGEIRASLKQVLDKTTPTYHSQDTSEGVFVAYVSQKQYITINKEDWKLNKNRSPKNAAQNAAQSASVAKVSQQQIITANTGHSKPDENVTSLGEEVGAGSNWERGR